MKYKLLVEAMHICVYGSRIKKLNVKTLRNSAVMVTYRVKRLN